MESAGVLTRHCVRANGREPRQPAEDAVRQEHHDGDQQHPDPEIPVLRIDAGELVARHHEDDRADEAAVEPAGAAEDEDHQHVAERWKLSVSSETVSVVCASSAPATPAITAAMV